MDFRGGKKLGLQGKTATEVDVNKTKGIIFEQSVLRNVIPVVRVEIVYVEGSQ